MSAYWIAKVRADQRENIPKKVITRTDWDKKLESVKIRKADMDKLVMNFLFTEGYLEAVKDFQKETEFDGIGDIDFAAIRHRWAVKRAVHRGIIWNAIEQVKNLNPEILDADPMLLFYLQQQDFVEMIRSGEIEKALQHAAAELAPVAEKNENLLPELEKTMTLLAFEEARNCPVGDLLDQSRRLKMESKVNAALLQSQGHEKDSKLHTLLKLLEWERKQLDELAIIPEQQQQ